MLKYLLQIEQLAMALLKDFFHPFNFPIFMNTIDPHEINES